MRDFDEEKRFLLPTVGGDTSVFEDVRLRLPELLFESCLRIDLGQRIVDIRYFGPGNTEGDTIVYLPENKIAWTGNLILGKWSIPALLEGRAGDYLETIARFERSLEVEPIVPGHGWLASGTMFSHYMGYLSDLVESVQSAVRAGRSLEETLETLTLPGQYMPTDEEIRSEIGPFITGLHRFNVQRTYQEIAGR